MISKRLAWLKEAVLTTDDGCVEWPFPLHVSGRPIVSHRYASRVAFELAYGVIPSCMHVLHRCDNPTCVNPKHLFSGSHADNMLDMASKGRAARGERSGHAKLTTAQVCAIRESTLSSRSIAPFYAVSDRQIRSIRAKQWWKHV